MRQEDIDDRASPSLLEEVEDKQEQLDALLEKLSKIAPETDNELVMRIGEEICDIYRNPLSDGIPFRHQYHFFLETLQSIRYPDYIDALMANLKTIIDSIERKEENEMVISKLLKLYDHISIDVVRMSMMSDTHRAFSKIMRTEDHIDHLEKKSDDTRKKVESLQMETVAILGVFAAIVIGFAGGLDVIG